MSQTGPAPVNITPVKITRINVIGIATLALREVRRSIRFFWFGLLAPAFTSLLFLSVFKLALASAGADEEFSIAAGHLTITVFASTGFIALSVMQSAFYGATYPFLFDKIELILQDILKAPMHGIEIAIGYVLASSINAAFVGGSVFLVLGPFIGYHIFSLPGLVFFLILAAVSLAALGLLAAIFSEKWDGLAAKETFFAIPLLQLSGAFFPIAAVDGAFWQTLIRANPFHYIVDGTRWALTGVSESGPLVSAAVTLVMAIGLVLITSIVFTRGYKLKD